MPCGTQVDEEEARFGAAGDDARALLAAEHVRHHLGVEHDLGLDKAELGPAGLLKATASVRDDERGTALQAGKDEELIACARPS